MALSHVGRGRGRARDAHGFTVFNRRITAAEVGCFEGCTHRRVEVPCVRRLSRLAGTRVVLRPRREDTLTERLVIALVADTHDAPDPVGSVRALQRVPAAYYVHLGDVGTSPLVAHLVRAFKQEPDWYERLTPAQRERFDSHCRAGRRPVSAYLEARLGDDPVLQKRRHDETLESYVTILSELEKLPEPIVVAGNVDRVWLRDERIQRAFASHGVRLVEWPEVLRRGRHALLLWPSLRQDGMDLDRLRGKLDALRDQLVTAETVVVCAHEQVFRGPAPQHYRANVLAAGLQPRTIPAFAPSPTRGLLVELLQTLPSSVRVGIASGHIHDGPDVVAAGAPYLQRLPSGGLRFRLPRGGGRTEIELFPVPADRPAVLVVGPTFRFDLLEVAA